MLKHLELSLGYLIFGKKIDVMKDCDLRPFCAEFSQYRQGHDRFNEQKSPCRRCKQKAPERESEYFVNEVIKFRHDNKDRSILILDKQYSQKNKQWWYVFVPMPFDSKDDTFRYTEQKYYGSYDDIFLITNH